MPGEYAPSGQLLRNVDGSIFLNIPFGEISVSAPTEVGVPVPPGLTPAENVAALNEIGLAGETALLGPFTYEIATPVDNAPRMRGVRGSTRLLWTGPRGSFASGASGIDFIENAMVRVRGRLDPATLDTVPTAVASGSQFYPPGSQAISVASTGLAGPDTWIFYSGGNDPAFQQYDTSGGDLLLWADLLQVDSIQAPLTFLLKHHTLSYHTVTSGASTNPEPISIRAAVPVVAPRFDGIIFDGGDYIAIGLLFELCAYGEVVDCEFVNFAVSGIVSRWVRGLAVRRPRLGGALSGLLLADATHLGVVEDATSDDLGLRYPPVGHGYGAVCLRNDSSEWRITHNEFAHFSVGFNGAGFRNVQHIGNKYRDLDCVEYAARDLADSSLYLIGVIGIGVHQGVVNLAVAAFNQGWTDVGTTIVDARTDQGTGAPGDDCSYWWHDTYMSNIAALTISNKGKSPYQNINGLVRYMLGLRSQDCRGQVSGLIVDGCEYALRINSTSGGRFDQVQLQSAPAQGAIANVGVMFETAFQNTELTHIVTFALNFQNADMLLLDYSEAKVGQFFINDWYFEGPGVIAQNMSGVVLPGGSVAAFSNASTGFDRLLVLTNDAAAQGLVKVIHNQGGFGMQIGGFGFVEGFGTYGRLACDATPVTLGAQLAVVGGGSILCSPAGTGPVVATAYQVKGAAVGTILAGKPTPP